MPSPPTPRSRWSAWRLRALLAVGLGTSVAVGWMGTQAERQGRQERLYREVDTAAQDLIGEFERYTALLRAMAAHFEVRLPTDDRDYQDFLERLGVSSRYPGLQATNLGLHLEPADVPAAVAAARSDRSLHPEGNPTFTLHPPLDESAPGLVHLVRFVYPLEGNQQALGYNSFSNPGQREALFRALDTGLMCATGPITLVQAPDNHQGLIVRMPILRAGYPVRTPAERRKATWGTVNGVWIPEVALSPQLKALAPTMEVQMVDLGWVDQPRPATPFMGPTFEEGDPDLLRRPVTFAGRMLELRFKARPGHPALRTPWRSWSLAAVMAALTLVGTYLVRILGQREQNARILAERLKEEAERAAETREREFQGFFERAPIPLAITRLEDGFILHANASWRALLEVPPDATHLGRSTDYYREVTQRDRVLEQIRRDGYVREVELPLRTAGGKDLEVLFSCEPIRRSGSTVLLSAFLDLTEIHRSEAALRQAQKLESMGLLAGGIAHDFNNLLTAVLGNLDLARSVDPERVATRLDAAEQAVRRASDLTRQLLVYSGRIPVQREPLDLSSLVRNMATLLQVSIPKAVRLEMDLPEGLPAVFGDRAQLQQAVMNLVTNAADAIPQGGGTIRLHCALHGLDSEELRRAWADQPLLPGPHLFLSVTDDGVGMDASVRSRIFDPFFTTKEQGRGLGLSALQGILRAHHGGMRIESEPGRGSTFTLALPTTEARPAEPTAAPDLPERFQGTALVVDDEADVRASASAMLQALGFEVLVAGGGAEGLAQARAAGEKLTLILLDLTMPPPDGRETYAALRAHRPELPIILSSGYSDAAPGALGQDPNLGFLPKPYSLKDLRASVAQRLASPGDAPHGR
ncbi:MAG TPA: CHASE domain-containing protein [Holophagaceae bacterium]|nr:CHASE domain-containing protein [Holophagaceae bacterium]